MGFSFNTNNNRSNRKMSLVSEINVTPLVDVMLVLLIVFMITSPLLIAGIDVDLPESAAAPIAGTDEPLTVTITDENRVFIHNSPVNISELTTKLLAITKENTKTRIFVRGDKNVDYGSVMRVVGLINQAGFTKVSLITEVFSDKANGK